MKENGRMTCDKARELDLVDYLSGLGFQPSRIRGNNFWYHSPFRKERTPSFKVDRKKNRWYDFGEGAGGNIIDFATRYNGITVAEFLSSLRGGFNDWQKPTQPTTHRIIIEPERKIEVIRIKPIFSYHLLHYLQERRIPIPIADKFCKEVNYKMGQTTYYGIGFKNDAGGWELRNRYFKGSSSPKEITSFIHGFNTVAVFEGFMDFLSYMTLLEHTGTEDQHDYLVLNSLPLFERACKLMDRYRSVQLYMDRDAPGRNYTQYALGLDQRYQDKSNMYPNHKDLNEWICHPGIIKPP